MEILSSNFTIICSLSAILIAQLIKVPIHYFLNHEWDLSQAVASGGFPSSHTAGVTACALAVGLRENFSSNLFAVILIIAIVIAYDAMNVRYYAGQNIQITQKLIKDITELSQIKLDDPIYATKMKEVLGHKGFEVIGGCIFGLLVTYILYLFIY